MAVLLSQCLYLALATCIMADGCFERFAFDEAKCKAAHGKCEWLVIDGEGKCMISEHKDGCFERFGSNKVNCTDANGLCLWVEKDGEGKCMMPRDSKGQNKNSGDDCFERFGFNKANCTATKGRCIWTEKDGEGRCAHEDGADRMDKRGADTVGKDGHRNDEKDDDRIRKEGSTKSREDGAHRISKDGGHNGQQQGADRVRNEHGRKALQKIVLETLKQQGSLLESALAHFQVYQKVTILGFDVARRLRAAINTQAHVRFEAEATTSPESSDEASSSPAQLKGALQEAFAKAGFDFQVQGATVAISSTEPIHTRSGDERHSAHFFMMVAAAAAGLILCTCGALLLICLRKRSRSAAKASAAKSDLCVAPVYGVPCKDNDKCDADIDLASISTGTPSTTDNLSESCL